MRAKNKHMKKKTLAPILHECSRAMCLPLLLNTIVAILSGTFGIIIANTIGNFADDVFQLNLSLGFQNILLLGLCIFAVVFITPGIGMLSDFIMLKSALRHDNIVFEHYLDKDPEKEKLFNHGEIQYELEDAPINLRIYWVSIFSKILSIPFCLVYLLYCSGQISWFLTILMFLLTALKLVIPLFFKEKLAAYDRQEKKYLAMRRDYETDAITTPHIVKLFGINIPILNRIQTLFHTYYETSASRQISCSIFFEQAKEFMNHFTFILLLLSGAIMVANRTVTPGELASIFLYVTVAQTIFNDIASVLQDYPLMINATNRVREFYKDKECFCDYPINSFETIKAQDLTFSYPDKTVLKHLNFSISQGDKITISGENGHGKSTLVKIICSLIKNYQGTILINGVDFKKVNINDWRKHIAYAPQIPFLFQTTVIDNITIANPTIDPAIVQSFMNDFGILQLANRMVDSSLNLSGGEKQKISIIRALIKESEILILDEPSNHLDQHSIAVLKKYISNTEKTILLISHDTSLSEATNRSISI